ncbi:hypothetical protein QBC34DRAFT_425912 [Podospora aff. communis PSN243]|uniref:BTB domain-containing protein n=1 Tax=Podospora aff. communis PSN243 TaxID=3040156 RepID=A0AAV9GN53_9PEZI|nr:hypothetical protein QBC34DRAFT_425912 [Podospora aff. communis PSN243]
MPPNRATKNKTRHCTSLADEEIRPNGDSVLVVGKERTILRVDSQTLIAASKVFKRLFQNSSSEAQDPAGNIVKVVYLEDDDPEAMWTLCCLLHDVYEIGDEEMVPPEVFLTAMHVKKFDLMGRDPVRGAMHLWLNPKLSTRFNGFEMGFHFAAAYLLQQLSSVVRWSQDLIFGYGGDYDALVAEILSRILPPQVFEPRRVQM